MLDSKTMVGVNAKERFRELQGSLIATHSAGTKAVSRVLNHSPWDSINPFIKAEAPLISNRSEQWEHKVKGLIDWAYLLTPTDFLLKSNLPVALSCPKSIGCATFSANNMLSAGEMKAQRFLPANKNTSYPEVGYFYDLYTDQRFQDSKTGFKGFSSLVDRAFPTTLKENETLKFSPFQRRLDF